MNPDVRALPPAKRRRADLALEHEKAMKDLALAQQTLLCVEAARRNAGKVVMKAREEAERLYNALEESYEEE